MNFCCFCDSAGISFRRLAHGFLLIATDEMLLTGLHFDPSKLLLVENGLAGLKQRVDRIASEIFTGHFTTASAVNCRPFLSEYWRSGHRPASALRSASED
jgi:hypothetical protein